jgi:hypothetical protein
MNGGVTISTKEVDTPLPVDALGTVVVARKPLLPEVAN